MKSIICNTNQGFSASKISKECNFNKKNHTNINPIKDLSLKSELNQSEHKKLNNQCQLDFQLYPRVPLIVFDQNQNSLDSESLFLLDKRNDLNSNQIKMNGEIQFKNVNKKPSSCFNSLKKLNLYIPPIYEESFIKECNENKKFLLSDRFKNNINKIDQKDSNENIHGDITNKKQQNNYQNHKDKTSKNINLKIFGKNHLLVQQQKNILKKLIYKLNIENKNKFKISFENKLNNKEIANQIHTSGTKKINCILENNTDRIRFNEINLNIKNITQNTFLQNIEDNQEYQNQFIQSINSCYENLYILNDKNLSSENLIKILNLQILINKDKFKVLPVELRLKFNIMIFSKFVNQKSFFNNLENFIDEIDFSNENQIKKQIFK